MQIAIDAWQQTAGTFDVVGTAVTVDVVTRRSGQFVKEPPSINNLLGLSELASIAYVGAQPEWHAFDRPLPFQHDSHVPPPDRQSENEISHVGEQNAFIPRQETTQSVF